MKKRGRGGQLLLTRNPKKDFYPEEAWRPRDLSLHPVMEHSVPVGKGVCPERRALYASPDLVGTIGTRGTSLESDQNPSGSAAS